MTWPVFIAQFHAVGRDKAEGYFPFHFEGMSEDERARARVMMEARGVEGDTTDLDGLRLIGDAASVAKLQAAQAMDRVHGIAFEVARRETLFALTNDADHLAPLLTLLDAPEDRDLAFVAQALARHPLPPSFASYLESRIVDGRHEVALLWIIKAWISAKGEPVWRVPVFDANLPFIRKVIAARPATRAVLLHSWPDWDARAPA
ncbi:hypothetical protein [Sphingomonas paucimobilis]|uniref:hypothetical protein n=1 Tax=Sphingomonas paucimobilis TaxID=13689 RepID=UPI0028CFFCCD|nr:hypothetical protein [Sphingomonas paucimobilis]